MSWCCRCNCNKAGYYESLGQNWERAAMIKARPVAADRAAGEAFLREIRPFVWRRSLDFGAIAEIGRLTARIRDGGPPNGVLCHRVDGKFDIAALRAEAAGWPGLEGMDLAVRVSREKQEEWGGGHWQLGKGYGRADWQGKPHVVAIDYGSKDMIFRNLAKAGYAVNPLDDGSLAPYQLLAFNISQLTLEAPRNAGESDFLTPLKRLAETLPRRGLVIVLSDFLGDPEPVETAMMAAADRGVRGLLLQVLDPAEEEFPYQGRTIFESMQGSLHHETQSAGDLRDRYLQRLAERKDRLSQLSAAMGWQYHCHHTGQPAQSALLWAYMALEGGK